MFVIGEQVGDYRVVTKLGAGGMGVVYGAEHALLGRPAALKILHPSLSSDHEMVERFFNEAKAASAIRHPGIVEVYTFGYHTDGTAYLAMAYLEGISLEQRVRSQGSLPEDQALRITSQIAGALGAAHGKHIVHRDLKPDNVFIVPDADMPGGERTKLLDFGIAKLAGEREPTGYKTKTGAVFGTPAYMSPEQCRGAGEVDNRSDLYALGCILYRMVCGRLPFATEDSGSGDVIAAQLRDDPLPPRSVAPAISSEVEGIILKLLEKEPANRYQSARELRSAIAAVLGESTGQTFAVTEASVGSADTIAGAATTLASAASQHVSGPDGRSRAGLWAIAALVLVCAGGASVYFAVTGAEESGGSTADAAVAASSDATGPVLAARIAATEADCRSAMTRASELLAGDVPSEAIPYVYLREFSDGGARATELVQSCVQGFDDTAVRCIVAAETPHAVAECGDELVARECARGDTDACGTEAGVAYDRQEYARALELATKSCDEGGRQACTLLGLLHYYGRGVERDYAVAFRFYSSAAGLGDETGGALAAMLLRYGVGVDKNETIAMALYEDACRLDERSIGCIGLGEMIWAERSRRRDALGMFDRTCKAGHARGCVLLADFGGRDLDALYRRARALYDPQIEHSPFSARRLAALELAGKGGEANPARAVELLTAACRNHEPFACEELGDVHVGGVVRLNMRKSREAYEAACEVGIARACERAECQRLSTEGRADDSEWSRRLRECRASGALGPGGDVVRSNSEKGPRRKPTRRKPTRKPPRKPPRQPPSGNNVF